MTKRRNTSSTKTDDGSYEVGYGKPPKVNQFRPGKSGNPAGRRKGSRNIATDVKQMLNSPVKVKENGRLRTRSTQQATLMVAREKALRGDIRSLNLVLDLAKAFNGTDHIEPDENISDNDQRIFDHFVEEAAKAFASNPPVHPSDPSPSTNNDPVPSGTRVRKRFGK